MGAVVVGVVWRCLIGCTLLLLMGLPAMAQTEQPDSPYLLDDATRQHDDGQILNFAGSYILDVLSNLSGGVRRHGETLGNLNLVFDLDGDRFGLTGGAFHLYLLANHGGSFSQHVGDYQTASHIEAPAAASLFEAYYEQRFFQDHLSLLGGLYAVDSEFDVRDFSQLFVHSSAGTGADLGQAGLNGPGIFPAGALGFRLRYKEHDRGSGWYAQAAMVEGVPGDPERPQGNHFHLSRGEGAFVIGEAGYSWEDDVGELGKVSLGGWGFTQPYATLLDTNRTVSNRGAYISLEKALSRERDDKGQGLTAYFRTGIADGRVNSIENFLGAGFVYTGAFDGRPRDQLGLGINSGLTSSDLVEFMGAEAHETAIELTYSFAISPNVSMQPDLQYVINPGFDPNRENAVVLGLRAVFTVTNQ